VIVGLVQPLGDVWGLRIECHQHGRSCAASKPTRLWLRYSRFCSITARQAFVEVEPWRGAHSPVSRAEACVSNRFNQGTRLSGMIAQQGIENGITDLIRRFCSGMPFCDRFKREDVNGTHSR